jgi:hypothetical protein
LYTCTKIAIWQYGKNGVLVNFIIKGLKFCQMQIAQLLAFICVGFYDERKSDRKFLTKNPIHS